MCWLYGPDQIIEQGYRFLDKLKVGAMSTDMKKERAAAESLYYSWSKEFLEAGKKRLAGDTARQTNTGAVRGLRREMRDMKELVADLALENRLLKKSMIGDGGDAA